MRVNAFGLVGALLTEARRLEILNALSLLDTPADPQLDEVAQLSAQLLHTPVALISVLDRDRQWFKARVGTCLTETPLSLSLCEHALTSRDLVVIPDARRDSAYAKHPAVKGPLAVRFYAGAPLVLHEGAAVGALCVVDVKPAS